jgi:CubicO group peptidase (beta-lactamase class C family)
MQLVDEGKVDLDVPVRRWLPEFATADGAAAAAITPRQLLAHTSGLDGDFFPADDAAGPSAESYLRKMHALPQLHAAGEFMTYCNAGYIVAGRLIEALRRTSWPNAVMDYVCRPLGMTHAFADPRESLRYRSAIGHLPDPLDASRLRLAPMPYLQLSMAAAGSVLSMSAADLLRFAGAHLRDGAIAGGRSLLSAAAARAMRQPHAEMLPFSRAGFSHIGLSWFLGEAGGRRVAGHDGATLGQMAYLHCVPELQLAFALLTNSPSTALFEEIRSRIFAEHAGITIAPEPTPVPVEFDARRYAGVYENVAMRMELRLHDGGLAVSALPRNPGGVPFQARLRPFAADCFQIEAPDPALRGKVLFVGDDGGRPRYVRMGLRMARRVG